MEAGEKMRELNMTVDEIDRLQKAFKDEKFREMLRDYAEEISDPENKKRYEEEISLLERERGNSIEFIHPTPFRALKTSVDGKQKCFVNICANEKVGQPECKGGVSEDGRRGQCWSLPHSLHPGRQDMDSKGNKIVVYDVIFHPDTLHMASRNTRFMDMVESTAIQGIQDAFTVTLDKNNVRVMNTKYKGIPQPCVIRNPIPGYTEPSGEPDPLAFPYPDEKGPTTSSRTKPADSPATKSSGDAKLKTLHIPPQETKEPTKPNYTVKYRSFVDLQDFRCSRDSARGPRPKEIVVTIDMPLLKSVSDVSLEVKEGRLVLESQRPAYRLELPLAYPVDEDKGEAKFYKQRGQLTVTLPVPPSNEAFDFSMGPPTTVSDTQSEGEDEGKGKKSEEDEWREQERGDKKGEEEQQCGEEKIKEERVVGGEDLRHTRGEEGEDEEREVQSREGRGGLEGEEGEVAEEAKWEKQNKMGQESVEEERGTESQKSDMICESEVEEEKGQKEDKRDDVKVTGNKSILIPAERGEVNMNCCLESTPKTKTSGTEEEPGRREESQSGEVQLEADDAFMNHKSSEGSAAGAESPTPATTTTLRHDTVDSCVSQGPEAPAADNAGEWSSGASGSGCREDEDEDEDEDDLPTEQIVQTPEHNKPPPAVLREIDEDGNEKIISDHCTDAGFTFQNSLIFELD